MTESPRARPARPARLLIDGEAPPARNMARDEALARLVGDRPALRLYGWRPAALSLGARQRAADVAALRARRPDLELVRRPTGGGAIVHEEELTYCLVGRYDAFGARGRTHPRALYLAVHEAIAAAVGALGGRAGAERPRGGAAPSAPGAGSGCCPPLCFERETDYDLVLPPHGKLAGSAQRRYRSAFLQHGSIPLRAGATPALGATSLEQVLGRPVGFYEAAQAVATAVGDRLALDLSPSTLTEEELRLAAALERDVYRRAAWTNRADRSGMYPDGDTQGGFALPNGDLRGSSLGPDLAVR